MPANSKKIGIFTWIGGVARTKLRLWLTEELSTVNGYKISIPRTIVGLAAVAMTALTLDALVFLPAKIDVFDGHGTLSRVVTGASVGASTIAASCDFGSVLKAASAVASGRSAKSSKSQRS
jgi:hypothetical protein